MNRLDWALRWLLLAVLALYLGGIVLSMLARIGSVVVVLIGAVFFAYLIYPVVARLKGRMPPVLAIVVVYAAIALVLAAAAALVVPRITDEVRAFAANGPRTMDELQSMLAHPTNPVLARLPQPLLDELARMPPALVGWLQLHGAVTAGHAATMLAGTFAALATFVVIPLLAAYMLMDADRMREGVLRLLPARYRETSTELFADIDRVIGGFIRGQLLVAATVGVLLTVVLLIARVPYAFLLGLVAGVGDLIPFVGAVLAFVPAVVIALLNNGWVSAAVVAVLFVVIYEVEGHLIAPAIVSTQVKVSPLVVIVAILIGAELGGVLGMLVAVPAAGILRVLVLRVANARAP